MSEKEESKNDEQKLLIKQAMSGLDRSRYTDDQWALVKKGLKEVLTEGKTPREVMGFTQGDLEILYTFGYDYFKAGKYKDAAKVFKMLVAIEPGIPRFLFALASTYHQDKLYDLAAPIYFSCAILDPGSPLPYFHASDCFIMMGDKVSAIFVLNGAIKRMGSDPFYGQMKQRAELMMQELKSAVNWDELMAQNEEEK